MLIITLLHATSYKYVKLNWRSKCSVQADEGFKLYLININSHIIAFSWKLLIQQFLIYQTVENIILVWTTKWFSFLSL